MKPFKRCITRAMVMGFSGLGVKSVLKSSLTGV